ncbi:MAG: TVP38/TMEM64 family protein [Nitrospira sp.]|nr:TVP38/TMEM64 family protein [Nitrospira sp.]
MDTPHADGHNDDAQHQTLPCHQSTPSGTSTKEPVSGKVIVALVIGLAIGGFVYFDLGQFLSLTALQNHRDTLQAFADTNYVATVGIFIAAYTIVTGLSLPGAVILTLAGGFLFGAVLGTLFVNVGATTGATLAFLTARYVVQDTVEQKFGKSLKPLQEGFAKNAFSYLLTLRLIPLFPFFVVNLVSGLTRVRVGTYIGATALGIVPGSFVYAYAGRQLGTINSLKEIASPNVILAFTLLGLLALVPMLYRRLTGKPAEPVNRTEAPSHP